MDRRGEATVVRLERAATLHLTSGRIVACDPLVFPDSPAFMRSVPPGDYPVEVSVAQIGLGHVRIAAVRVLFATRPVARWEMATVAGQDVATLGDGEIFGYPVDAGLGCFMDLDAAPMLDAAMQLPDDGNYYDDVLAKELESPDREYADHHPVAGRPENVVIVHSGWGDGMYASYWGIGDDGAAVQLVTDFAVF